MHAQGQLDCNLGRRFVLVIGQLEVSSTCRRFTLTARGFNWWADQFV